MIDVNKLQFGVEYTLKKGDKTFKGYLTRRTRPFNDVWLSGVLVDRFVLDNDDIVKIIEGL